jgi:uroporphyrinogen-III synthase
VAAADPADLLAGDAPATAAAEAPGTTFTASSRSVGPVRVVWARGSASSGDGPALAEALAREIAATIDRRAGARRPRVLVTRDAERAGPLVDALRARGLDPVHVPTISVEPGRPGGPLDDAVPAAGSYAWVVVTSPAGADALGAAAARRGADLASARIASVGAATTAAVERAGGHASFVPGVATATVLAEELPVSAGDRVLLVRGNLADERLGRRLRSRGAAVDEVVAYRTVEAPATSAEVLRTALRAGLAGLVFTSGSTVRGLLALLDAPDRIAVLDLPAFCIGPSTASVARGAGFSIVHEAAAPDPGTLAGLVRARLAEAAGARPSLVTTLREAP